MTGAADKVGFLSKSNSIQTLSISLLMGACVALGFMVSSASTLLCWFYLIKFYSLATMRSKAQSNSSILILSLLSIFNISRSKAMNQLLKLYCPITDSNLYQSLPGLMRDCCSPYAILSSGNNLQSSQMQFILVLAAKRGFPRMSQLIRSPAANTRDRQSISLLVRTDYGEEYLRSCSYTRSNLVRSRLAKASKCATFTVRKLLLTKREVGLSSLGNILASVRWMTIWMRVLLILKMSSFCNSVRMTASRLRSRLSKMQQKLFQSLTIYLMLAISLALELFISEMFLFLRTYYQVLYLCSFLTVTDSRVSLFQAWQKENHRVFMIRSNNRYFYIILLLHQEELIKSSNEIQMDI